MRRATVLFLVFGMVALAATASDARGHRAGSGPQGCGMGACMAMCPMQGDSSGMSKELMDKIEKDRQVLMTETLGIRTQLFEKTERFQMLMSDSKAKDEDILKMQQEIHALKGQLAQKHLQHMLKIRKELPEGARQGCMMMGPGCGMGPCGGMGGMGACGGMGPMDKGPMHGRGMGKGMEPGQRGCCGPMM